MFSDSVLNLMISANAIRVKVRDMLNNRIELIRTFFIPISSGNLRQQRQLRNINQQNWATEEKHRIDIQN